MAGNESENLKGKWPYYSRKSTPAKSKVSAWRGMLAGMIVIGLATGAYFLIGRHGKVERSEAPKNDECPQRSRKNVNVPKATRQPSRLAPTNATEVATSKPEAPEKTGDSWLGVQVDHRDVATNGTTIVETIYTVDGKMHKYYHSATEPVFETATDQVLAWATADAPPGGSPPLPSLGKDFANQFVESLKTEIVIKDTDSDEVKAVKKRVIEARQGLLKAMEEGMSAEEVIAEHRRMLEHDAKMRMDAVKGLKDYLDKGDTEGAQVYVSKMNEALESMGIMKIEIPRPREELIAEAREKAAIKKEQSK